MPRPSCALFALASAIVLSVQLPVNGARPQPREPEISDALMGIALTGPHDSPDGQPTQGRQAIPPPPNKKTPDNPGSDYKWWQDPAVIKAVGVNDQQVARIDKIFDQREKDIAPFVKDLTEQRAVLQRMLQERTADIPTLQLQVSRVDQLSARVHESRILMLYRMWLVLTTDQYKKLETFQDQNRRGRRGGG